MKKFVIKGLILKFWLKFLIIPVLILICLNLKSFAQEAKPYFSIPDFTIHRVTPEKNSEIKPSVTENKQAVTGKIIAKQETPKKSETIVLNQTEKPDKNNKQNAHPQLANNSTTNEGLDTGKVDSKSVKTEEEPQYETDKEAALNLQNNETEKINKTNQLLNEDVPQKTNKFNEAGSDFFRALFSLSVVIILFLVVAWIYARLKGINPTAILTGKFSEKNMNRFNILSTSTLGQGKDIHLVEINGKQLVIGSTSSNINLLTEIPPEEIEKLKSRHSQPIPDENQEEPAEQKDAENIEIPEDENFHEFIEEEEDFENSDYYFLTYPEVYKEYIKDEDE